MKRDIRITQIANNLGISKEEAEKIFREEICEKYGTENLELAEMIYRSDHW